MNIIEQNQSTYQPNSLIYIIGQLVSDIYKLAMKDKDFQEVVKLILIGDSFVGKTSLLRRYCYGTFSSHQKPTVGLQYGQKIVNLRQKRVLIQLWDTAGQEKFKTLTPSYYRSAMGIILVFSVDDRESFNSIAMWMKQIHAFAVERIPIILACNKADILKRQVSQKQAMALAEQYHIDLIFVSSKENVNVDEMILRMYNKIEHEPLQNSQKKGSNLKNQARHHLHSSAQTSWCSC